MLSPDELHRFQRHIRLPDVGLVGQQRLKAARLIVTGSAAGIAAELLRNSGVGRVDDRYDTAVPHLHLHASACTGRAWLLGFASESACATCAALAGYALPEDDADCFGAVAETTACLAVNASLQMLIEPGVRVGSLFLEYDARELSLRHESITRHPECHGCRDVNLTTEPLPRPATLPPTNSPRSGANDGEMHVEELQLRLQQDDAPIVIDVREHGERELGHIASSHWIPLRDVAAQAGELSREHEYVVYCKAGTRSAKAVRILRDAGFERVWNLQGGIMAWAERIDPSLPKY